MVTTHYRRRRHSAAARIIAGPPRKSVLPREDYYVVATRRNVRLFWEHDAELKEKRKQDYSTPDYLSNTADKKGKNKGVRIEVQFIQKNFCFTVLFFFLERGNQFNVLLKCDPVIFLTHPFVVLS